MTILSKTWLQAWLTLPDLKFTMYYLNRNTNIVDNIMERYRDGKIPIQKFELSYFVHYTSDFFHLIDKWLDIVFQNGVENLIFRVHVSRSYRWSIFKIMAAKSLRELVLSNCDLMYDSLSSGVAGTCSSLRKLSLSYIILNDNILQTLLNSCPLIVTFTLQYCSGLEKIELPNLQKIKSVSMKMNKNQRVKIEAPTLEHLFFSGFEDEYPMLDIIDRCSKFGIT
uniref:F-box/LRR-repeat protein n=1 Tax=Solanum tuberosum TaxID=4113 RepID=M1DDE4_SOLTU